MQSKDPGLPAPQSHLHGLAGYGLGRGLVLLCNEQSRWPEKQGEGNLGGEPGPPESRVWCSWLGAIRQLPIFYLKSTISPDYTRPCRVSQVVLVVKNRNPLQYSCLENPMDRGAFWAIVHAVTKSQTQLSIPHTHINPCTSTAYLNFALSQH